MTTYSREERLAAIQKAGFANPLTALAVSLAEFGDQRDINAQGQSDVKDPNGPNGKEDSWGPWQINLKTWGGPSRIGSGVSRSCALDLSCSTDAAQKISSGGTDFGAWSAFTNGSYQRFVAEIQSLLPSPSDGAGLDAGSSPSSSSAAPAATPSATTTKASGVDFLKALPSTDNLWRVGFVVLGGLLILFGARLYFHQDTGSEQSMPEKALGVAEKVR